LKVEGAADDADYVTVLNGTEAVVRLHVAKSGAVLTAHDDEVWVLFHQSLETVAPSFDALGDVAAASHADDVVDEGVATGGEVAALAEAARKAGLVF
jgi:hypothetical protein